jgi:hypothetical protein
MPGGGVPIGGRVHERGTGACRVGSLCCLRCACVRAKTNGTHRKENPLRERPKGGCRLVQSRVVQLAPHGACCEGALLQHAAQLLVLVCVEAAPPHLRHAIQEEGWSLVTGNELYCVHIEQDTKFVHARGLDRLGSAPAGLGSEW